MKWTVVWHAEAESRLAALWNDVTDKRRLTRAVDQLDHDLRLIPQSMGESRFDDLRIYLSYPIAIAFTISPDDRLVSGVEVWLIEPRRGR